VGRGAATPRAYGCLPNLHLLHRLTHARMCARHTPARSAGSTSTATGGLRALPCLPRSRPPRLGLCTCSCRSPLGVAIASSGPCPTQRRSLSSCPIPPPPRRRVALPAPRCSRSDLRDICTVETISRSSRPKASRCVSCRPAPRASSTASAHHPPRIGAGVCARCRAAGTLRPAAAARHARLLHAQSLTCARALICAYSGPARLLVPSRAHARAAPAARSIPRHPSPMGSYPSKIACWTTSQRCERGRLLRIAARSSESVPAVQCWQGTRQHASSPVLTFVPTNQLPCIEPTGRYIDNHPTLTEILSLANLPLLTEL
jgi:hypothetical protein